MGVLYDLFIQNSGYIIGIIILLILVFAAYMYLKDMDFGSIADAVGNVGEGIISGVTKGATGLVSGIGSVVGDVGSTLTGGLTDRIGLTDVVKDPINTTKNIVKDPIGGVTKTPGKIVSGIF